MKKEEESGSEEEGFSNEEWKVNNKKLTPVDWLSHWERTTPNRIYLRQPINRRWREYTLTKGDYTSEKR